MTNHAHGAAVAADRNTPQTYVILACLPSTLNQPQNRNQPQSWETGNWCDTRDKGRRRTPACPGSAAPAPERTRRTASPFLAVIIKDRVCSQPRRVPGRRSLDSQEPHPCSTVPVVVAAPAANRGSFVLPGRNQPRGGSTVQAASSGAAVPGLRPVPGPGGSGGLAPDSAARPSRGLATDSPGAAGPGAAGPGATGSGAAGSAGSAAGDCLKYSLMSSRCWASR